ncbi:hypothetical protein [Clostridium estertheticum]|nr:hypothetical protein [Clostridium estertheticum]
MNNNKNILKNNQYSSMIEIVKILVKKIYYINILLTIVLNYGGD